MTPKEYIIYLENQGIPRPSLLFLASAEFGDVAYRLELGNCKRPIDADWTDEVQDYIDSLPARPSLLFLASAAYQEQATVWQGVEPYCLRESNQNTGMQGFRRLRLVDVSTGKSMGITKPNEPGVEGYIAPVQNSAACPIPGTLSISPDSRSLGPGEYTFPLYITSNSDWTISGAPSGLSFSTTSGSGSQVVQVTVSGNTQESERTLSFFVATTGGTTRSMTITQEAYVPPFIEVTPNTFDVGAGIENRNIQISSNKEWVIVSNAPELLINPRQGGAGTTTVSVTVGANNTFSEREFDILVETEDLQETVTIHQEAQERTLSVDRSGESVGPDSGSVSFLVYSNTDWEVVSAPPEVTLSRTSGTGDRGITVTYPANSTEALKNYGIQIETLEDGKVAHFNIAQDFSTLTVSPTSYDARRQGVSIQVTINTNASWEISGDSGLFFNGYPSTTGQGNSTVTLEIDENLAFSPRVLQATVTVPGKSQNITINQEANVRTLSITPTSRNIGYQAGSSSFQINSNTDWELYEIPDWMQVDIEEGSGNGQVSITYEENPVAYMNTGTIRVRLKDEQSTTAFFQLIQSPAPQSLTISPSDRSVGVLAGSTNFQVYANTEWRVLNPENLPAWVTVSPLTGEFDGMVSVTFTENIVQSPRNVDINVSTADGGIVRTFALSQAAAQENIIYKDITITAVEVGQTSVTIQTDDNISEGNVELLYRKGTAGNWIDAGASFPQEVPLRWTISGLEDGEQYQIRLQITSVTGLNETTVYQSNILQATTEVIPFLNLSRSSVTLESDETGFDFNVNSNVDWTITDNAAWMSVSPTSGSNNDQITATLDQNTGVLRTGTITVNGQGVSNRQLVVTQRAVQLYTITIKGTGTTGGVIEGADTAWDAISNTRNYNLYGTKSTIEIGTILYEDSGANTPADGQGDWYRWEDVVFQLGSTGLINAIIPVDDVEDPDPPQPDVGIMPPAIIFPARGGREDIEVTAPNRTWQVTVPSDPAISVSPITGNGNGTFTVTVLNNTNNQFRDWNLTVNIGGENFPLLITQAGAQ